MKYKLFSMPACPKCKDVKALMAESDMPGEEVSLSDKDGLMEMRKLYPKIRSSLNRTEDGAIVVPVVVFFEDDDSLAGVATTLDEVKGYID